MQIRLDIYGDGPLLGVLKRAAEGPAVISFGGYLAPDELRIRYREYDGFLLTPTRAPNGDLDGIPVVLMEAMAACVPVLSTPVGGIAELIVPGRNGTILPPDDAGIVRVMSEAFARYDSLLAMADAGRRTVRESYNLKKLSAWIVGDWERVVGPLASTETD